jgi:hypothetical protein
MSFYNLISLHRPHWQLKDTLPHVLVQVVPINREDIQVLRLVWSHAFPCSEAHVDGELESIVNHSRDELL